MPYACKGTFETLLQKRQIPTSVLVFVGQCPKLDVNGISAESNSMSPLARFLDLLQAQTQHLHHITLVGVQACVLCPGLFRPNNECEDLEGENVSVTLGLIRRII